MFAANGSTPGRYFSLRGFTLHRGIYVTADYRLRGRSRDLGALQRRILRTPILRGNIYVASRGCWYPAGAAYDSSLSIRPAERPSFVRSQRSGTLELRLKPVVSLQRVRAGTGVRSSVRALPRLAVSASCVPALLFPIAISLHSSKPGKLVHDTSIHALPRCSPRHRGL